MRALAVAESGEGFHGQGEDFALVDAAELRVYVEGFFVEGLEDGVD